MERALSRASARKTPSGMPTSCCQRHLNHRRRRKLHSPLHGHLYRGGSSCRGPPPLSCAARRGPFASQRRRKKHMKTSQDPLGCLVAYVGQKTPRLRRVWHGLPPWSQSQLPTLPVSVLPTWHAAAVHLPAMPCCSLPWCSLLNTHGKRAAGNLISCTFTVP